MEFLEKASSALTHKQHAVEYPATGGEDRRESTECTEETTEAVGESCERTGVLVSYRSVSSLSSSLSSLSHHCASTVKAAQSGSEGPDLLDIEFIFVTRSV
jgi:hypothetical protein